MSSRRTAAMNPYGRAAPPHMADNDDAGFVTRFIRDEITHPEKLPGNISIAAALVVFAGGIAAIRTWGELMIPA
jgi:hypothetical protein